MSQIAQIHYGALLNNETKTFDFCKAHGLGTPSFQAYPIGFCRENKKEGKKPCKHKTEEEAKKCYIAYELEYFTKGLIEDEDVVFHEELVMNLRAVLARAEDVSEKIKQRNKRV